MLVYGPFIVDLPFKDCDFQSLYIYIYRVMLILLDGNMMEISPTTLNTAYGMAGSIKWWIYIVENPINLDDLVMWASHSKWVKKPS